MGDGLLTGLAKAARGEEKSAPESDRPGDPFGDAYAEFEAAHAKGDGKRAREAFRIAARLAAMLDD